MEKRDFSKVEVASAPIDGATEPLLQFRKYISAKYDVKLESFWDFHQWSINYLSEFWTEIWKLVGVIHSTPYESVLNLDANLPCLASWFPGVRLNYAQNLLKYRDDRTAIVATGEEKNCRKYSYTEVYREASRYASSLRMLGVRKNDHVVCFMPNREEPIFAMLGTTSIGAIWSGTLSLYGAKAVLSRFKRTSPKVLFTIDKFTQNGEKIEMLEKVKEISQNLPSLEKIVIVSTSKNPCRKHNSEIRNSCLLDEFLLLGENSDGSVPELCFEQLPFDHPVFINYTSGTTGEPKAVIHGIGGLLPTARDFWLHCHTTRDVTWLTTSPVGWLTWNQFTSLLAFGVTIVVFEGIPFFRSPTMIYDLIDEYGIMNLLIAPTILDELEKKKYLPDDGNHLSSLRSILTGGSIVRPQNYNFVYKSVKKEISFRPAYGCTEIFGMCLNCDVTLPVYRGEISAPTLGIDFAVYDESGTPVFGEVGEMVIRNAIPSFPLGLWGDTDGLFLMQNYFTKYPGAFATGDFAIINPVTKGTVIYGRSDETLKQRGCRFGSSEIYKIVDLFPEVMDCLCVSQYNKEREERAVLFLVMSESYKFTKNLVKRIREAIEKELSQRHIPDVILQTSEIPINMNGKKVEILVKKIINNLPHNSDSVKNPVCLKNFHNIPELQGF